eukprot:1000826_1
MDQDIEIVTEDSVNIKRTPTPSDDAEEEESQSSAGTQEDEAQHAKVGTPVRVTLQSAWDSGGTTGDYCKDWSYDATIAVEGFIDDGMYSQLMDNKPCGL